MIEGVFVQDIDANDYYRRFILLKVVLKKGKEDSLLQQNEQYRRYMQLQKQLDSLDELVSTKNQKMQARVDETVLRIDELLSRLQHMIPKVRQKKDSFESDLLKRWRGALAAKKIKEEQTKLQKDAKSTSNKNLMYLTSQLLKKERISSKNLIKHKEKVEEIQKNIVKMLKEADQQLRQKFESLGQLINEQKSKVNEMIEQYKQSLTAQQDKFKAESKQLFTRIQQKIKAEHQYFLTNTKQIKQLISIISSHVM